MYIIYMHILVYTSIHARIDERTQPAQPSSEQRQGQQRQQQQHKLKPDLLNTHTHRNTNTRSCLQVLCTAPVIHPVRVRGCINISLAGKLMRYGVDAYRMCDICFFLGARRQKISPAFELRNPGSAVCVLPSSPPCCHRSDSLRFASCILPSCLIDTASGCLQSH